MPRTRGDHGAGEPDERPERVPLVDHAADPSLDGLSEDVRSGAIVVRAGRPGPSGRRGAATDPGGPNDSSRAE